MFRMFSTIATVIDNNWDLVSEGMKGQLKTQDDKWRRKLLTNRDLWNMHWHLDHHFENNAVKH